MKEHEKINGVFLYAQIKYEKRSEITKVNETFRAGSTPATSIGSIESQASKPPSWQVNKASSLFAYLFEEPASPYFERLLVR